jgi:hypothetical protein
MARRVVSRVLTEKVQDGYLTEDEAAGIARTILRDAPAELFKLKLGGGQR